MQKEKSLAAFERKLTVLASFLCLFLLETKASFASVFFDKVNSGISSIYGDIFKIVTPLFALIVLIGCARIFLANGRKAEGILDWLKRAGLAFVAILALGWIIAFITELTAGGSYSF